jgi:tRNA pseudouridine(38-40) synthase
MAEDSGTPIQSPVQHRCDEETSQSSPKRVKLDTQTTGADPSNSSTDAPQSNKKSRNRRGAAGYSKSRQGKEKDNKNVGRRRGDRPERNETRADASKTGTQDMPDKAPRLPKRQSAILLGFCGTGCAGMQMQVSYAIVSHRHHSDDWHFRSQPNARTIEGVLFDSLVRVGAVSSDNADDPTKVSLGRAARTDAGVHAAGNLVSLKLITQIPGVPDVVTAVNKLLPPEIRVWGIIRVQNSFNARTYACFPTEQNARIYWELVDPAIAANTRTSFRPTSSSRQSPVVDYTKRSAVRQSHRQATHPVPAHLLIAFMLSGLILPPGRQKRTIYNESADGALAQRLFADYVKSRRSSKAHVTSTTLQ